MWTLRGPCVDPVWRVCGCAGACARLRLGGVESRVGEAAVDMNLHPREGRGTTTPEARRRTMSLVNRQGMGMLSSVMRALKHRDGVAMRLGLALAGSGPTHSLSTLGSGDYA